MEAFFLCVFFSSRNEVVKSSKGKERFWKYALSQHNRKRGDSNISQFSFDQHFSKKQSLQRQMSYEGETHKTAFVPYLTTISQGNPPWESELLGFAPLGFPVCKTACVCMQFRIEGWKREEGNTKLHWTIAVDAWDLGSILEKKKHTQNEFISTKWKRAPPLPPQLLLHSCLFGNKTWNVGKCVNYETVFIPDHVHVSGAANTFPTQTHTNTSVPCLKYRRHFTA